MFNIIFYKNSSENNRVDKTDFLIKYIELQGELKDSTSIINPTITIDVRFTTTRLVSESDVNIVTKDNVDIISINSLQDLIVNCNYCYIPQFNRYYYINDIVSVRTNLWEISMSVDVLMSFKDKIREQKGLVDRNEFSYELYAGNKLIKDTMLPISQAANFSVRTYNSGFTYPENIDTDLVFAIQTVSFSDRIIRTARDTDFFGSSMSDTYLLDFTSVRNIIHTMIDPDFWENVGNLFGGDPTEGVIGIIEYPFIISNYYKQSNELTDISEIPIPYGNNITNITGKRINSNRNIIISSEGIRIKVYNFYEYPPYTRYILYLPFYGQYELDERFFEYVFYVNYLVNLETGTAEIIFTSNIPYDTSFENAPLPSGPAILATLSCNIGRKLPLTRSNALERFQGYVSTATKIVTGAVTAGIGGFVGGAIAGNIASSGAGGTLGAINQGIRNVGNVTSSGVKTFSDGLIDSISNHPRNEPATTNDVLSGYYNLNIELFTVSPSLIISENTNEYLEFQHLYGRPVNNIYRLGDLNGYTILDTIHLDGFDNTLSFELDEIERLLKSGIIL